MTKPLAIQTKPHAVSDTTHTKATDRRKAEAVAKQFEAMLIGQLVHEMRSGTDMFGSSDPSAKMYDSMFDQALAERVAGNRFGLKKMVMDGIDRTQTKTKPNLKMASGIEKWDDTIVRIAQEEKVDPNLVRAVMSQESGGKPFARSRAGACGLMQLMPDTARQMGVKSIFHPEENIRGGVRYLKEQLEKFGRVDLALAAYNAGPGAVERHHGVPPYSETKNYVRAVMSRMQSATLQEKGNEDER